MTTLSRHRRVVASLVASAAAAPSPSVSAFQHHDVIRYTCWRRSGRQCTSNTCTAAQSKLGEQNDDDNDIGYNDRSSIDDYVLNVHGGKYLFDDPSSIGTAASREFVQSLYSSASDTVAAEAERAEEEEAMASRYDAWPNWAKRVVTNASAGVAGSTNNILQISRSGEVATVTIQNQYRTWEPYYLRIVGTNGVIGADDASNQCPYHIISKIHGKLAPCGGVDVYSDSANIGIRYVGSSTVNDDEDWLLVAGTEDEQWYYRLVLS